MLDYKASFISFHLFLTFRNSEEHPSKFSPIFKVLFFFACGSRSEHKFSKGILNSRRTTELRPLPYFSNGVLSYFLSVAEYPQALGLKKFWISFLQHVVVITVFYVLVVGCLEREWYRVLTLPCRSHRLHFPPPQNMEVNLKKRNATRRGEILFGRRQQTLSIKAAGDVQWWGREMVEGKAANAQTWPKARAEDSDVASGPNYLV